MKQARFRMCLPREDIETPPKFDSAGTKLTDFGGVIVVFTDVDTALPEQGLQGYLFHKKLPPRRTLR